MPGYLKQGNRVFFIRKGGATITNNELNIIFDEQVKRCEAVLLHKGKEYAPDETDRLSSFKVAAALLHCTQQEALCGMLAKHIVSVYDMCLAGAERYSPDAWDEKITDSINYLILLNAIVKGVHSHNENRSENTELFGNQGG